MATNSNRRRSGGKPCPDRPAKPKPDFPLYAHKVGRWAKKVRGRTHYFTSWHDDPKGVAALEEWLDQKDDLLAGREPRSKTEGLTVARLCDHYIDHKKDLRDNGELSPRTYLGYYTTCETVVKQFGRNQAVMDLVPADFRKLRATLAKSRGLVALRNAIQNVRSIFKFGFDEGLILSPVRFGQAFAKPKKDSVNRERETHRTEHGDRMFESPEIREIIATVKQPLKTMVLLGANCAFGQTDLSSLPRKAVDLESGWCDYPRPKTAVRRRIPLWPETIDAIREWLPLRPKAKELADAGLLFLTCRGTRWVKLNANGQHTDSLGQEFNKVLNRLDLKRSRLGFYGLRHTFETIAGETADQVAVDAVMGHKRDDMAAHYRERIGDDRLIAVVAHVRNWLFADNDAPGKKNPQICCPSDPCDPGLAGKQTSGSQDGSQKKGLATPENPEKMGLGSQGTQG